MKQRRYPAGWDENRVKRVLEYYESQSDEEAIAEDEAAFEAPDQTTMEVPNELVPKAKSYRARHVGTAKDELKDLLEQQPEDSSSEELVRELAFHVMIQRGLADSDAGRTISNEEMGRRIRSWPK